MKFQDKLLYLWYFLVSKKFRILASNIWFNTNKPSFLDKEEYISESGLYRISFYKGLNFLSLFKKSEEFEYKECKYFSLFFHHAKDEFFLNRLNHLLLKDGSITIRKRNNKLNKIK